MDLKKINVYNPYTEQYILTTRETIAFALLAINRKLQTRWYATVSDFDIILGGKSTRKGNKLGWSLENEVQMDFWNRYLGGTWVDIEPEIKTEKDKTSLWIYFNVYPEDITEDIRMFNE